MDRDSYDYEDIKEGLEYLTLTSDEAIKLKSMA
jgi:hypothetical protein